MKTTQRTTLSVHIIAFGVFSAVCYFGSTVIVTIILAILTAYLLDPLVHVLVRIRFPKVLAISVSMIVAIILMASIVILFFARAQEFSDNLPRYRTKIQRFSGMISKRILALEKKSQDISKTILPKEPPNQQKPLRVELESSYGQFLFRNAAAYLIQISFFPFLVYFFLTEKDNIRNFVSNTIRGRTSLSTTIVVGASDRIVQDVSTNIKGFVVGYLVSTMILFAFSWILFLLFQAEEALVWAFIFALFNILPFVGAALSVLPPLAVSILYLTSVQQGLILIGLCVLLHLIYANLLIPRTTGPRTELSPLIVLIAMMYWGFLWGAIGIFLAIPLTASLRTIWIQYQKLQRMEYDRDSAA